jgi:hypothetical protein
MGEAKRRGTREQRIAQAIERKKAEDAALHQRYLAKEAERRERERTRLAALPEERRREAVFISGGGSHRSHLALAALLGLGASAPLLMVDTELSPTTRRAKDK